MNARRGLALVSIIMAYILIVLGGWIRATNSGLSCPDWPTCYGQWVLTPTDFADLGDVGYSYFQMMLEWSHRFIAGIVLGPMIMVLTLLSWRARASDRTGYYLSIVILVILLIQAKLGGVTVLDANSPWSVAVHLTNALILTGLLILFAVRLSNRPAIDAGSGIALLALTVSLLAMATMATAAVTSKMGAALACYDWPTCDGQHYLPSTDGDPGLMVHLMHRSLAALTGLSLLALWIASVRRRIPRLTAIVSIAAAIMIVQILLGAGVILWQVPVPVAVAHQAIGVLLFIKLAAITCSIRHGLSRNGNNNGIAHASV